MTSDINTTLREQFALGSFKPGQERIIRALLAGRDVLAVLPTGGGKSLVYQLASQDLPGITIVVSPLLALMKDQIDSVEQLGVKAGVVNSTLSESEAEDELAEVTGAIPSSSTSRPNASTMPILWPNCKARGSRASSWTKHIPFPSGATASSRPT